MATAHLLSVSSIEEWYEYSTHRLSPYKVEICVLFVLAVLTLFRKDLSANRSYRSRSSSHRKRLSIDYTEYLNDLRNTDWNNYVSKLATDIETKITTSIPDLNPLTISPVFHQNRPDFNFLQLNRDIMLLVVECLSNTEISRFSCVSKYFASLLSSDFIWEQLWIYRYGKIWQHPLIKSVRTCRNIRWDPYNNWGPPSQGWKIFVQEFEYGWVNWLLAGCNTKELCLVGIDGNIYNVTNFIDHHPGSSETLLDHTGGDATKFFYDIGHSNYALTLREAFMVIEDVYSTKCKALSPNPILTHFTLTMNNERKVVKKYVVRYCKSVNQPLESPCSSGMLRDLTCYSDDNITTNTDMLTNMLSLEDIIISEPTQDYEKFHLGQPRLYYDPLRQEWYVWWTCCGMERCVPREILNEQEEE